MTEERQSSNTAAKLLITSPDDDPKAELPFSERAVVRWDAIGDALSEANYCFAMHRLTPLSRHLTATGFLRNVAILSLHASKKAAFLYSNVDDIMDSYYEISHEECLMDHSPSHLNLNGLPRFHRFSSLPEELQLSIVRLLDDAGFATMRCVCRRFSPLWWDHDFDILRILVAEEMTRRWKIWITELHSWSWGLLPPFVWQRWRAPLLMLTMATT